MIPFVGQTVLTEGISSNGVTVHPAIVTRVWSPGQALAAGPVALNVTVLPDLHPPVSRSSVLLFANREAARASGNGLAAFPVE